MTTVADETRQLRLPTFEGQRITDHRLYFSGDIPIEDDTITARMKLNEEVRLLVWGRIVTRKHSIKRDGEGYVTAVINGATVLVEGVAVAE